MLLLNFLSHLDFFLNCKRIFFLIILIFIIPTYIWEGLYMLFVANFNCHKFLNSIPILLLMKHNFKNSSFMNFVYYSNIYPKKFNNQNLNYLAKAYVDNFKLYKNSEKISFYSYKPIVKQELAAEAESVWKKALEFKSMNVGNKARKLLAHALKLDPHNPNILAEYGEIIEIQDTNVILAEFFCTKALLKEPAHIKAEECRRRTAPVVEELDQKRLNQIDAKVALFFQLPENHPRLKHIKKEQYISYIYHTIAIEGNTLSLAQTRVILETRIAVGGKSLLEQNEVMGIDLALKYLNSLLNEGKQNILIDHILEIHKRVLSFVDISEAGRFRQKQVFIADHTPPPSEEIPELMAHFVNWINSEEIKELHPIELAALSHWKFVFLHPFQDGNGRTARLLMNFILMRANYPPSIITMEDREKYFQLLKTANEGDVRPFIRFIANCTERTIDDYLMTKYSDSIDVVTPKFKIDNKNLSVLDLDTN